MDLAKKIGILANAAKYDVSCATSGSKRKNTAGGLGNAMTAGICHSFADDGRCVSLLKVLFTNQCMYDCAYCINRRSNDVPRAAFTVDELVDLTINFYRRNYIEGLFLSSGVVVSPDHTMERLVSIAKRLRLEHKFNGYIHLKAIPGASSELLSEAGLYADRMSVNIEIPTDSGLKYLAPEKDHASIIHPMLYIKDRIVSNKEERRVFRKAPLYTPGGQSTQVIVGATNESDSDILHLASGLYKGANLKRVYYSGYLPTNAYDKRLPAVSAPPLKRENRLYQADWLLRFYHFNVDELVDTLNPNLDLDIDPKAAYAIRHPEIFPVDVNRADYEMLLRVPGIGVRSAKMIVEARRYRRLDSDNLRKIGVVMRRAKYFVTCHELPSTAILNDYQPNSLKSLILHDAAVAKPLQLSLF
jgi:putative DNA modification/repair radical SAM protein